MSDGWSWEDREYRDRRLGSHGSRERRSPRSPPRRYPPGSGSNRAASCSKESSRSADSASSAGYGERSYADRERYAFGRRDSRHRYPVARDSIERYRDHAAGLRRASSSPEELLLPSRQNNYGRSRGDHEYERQRSEGSFSSRYTDEYTQSRTRNADERQSRKHRSPPSLAAASERSRPPTPELFYERRSRPSRDSEEQARPQSREGRKRQRQDHPGADTTHSTDPRGFPRRDLRASPPVRAIQASAPPTDPRRRPRPSPRASAASPRGSTAASSSPREASGARSPASSASGTDRGRGGGGAVAAAADPRKKNPWAAVLDIAPDGSFPTAGAEEEEPHADRADHGGGEVGSAAADREDDDELLRREVKREPRGRRSEPRFAGQSVAGTRASGSENDDRVSSSNSSSAERGRVRPSEFHREEAHDHRGNGDVQQQPAPLSVSIAGVTLGGSRSPPPPRETSGGSGVHVRLPLHGRPAPAHQDLRSAAPPRGPIPHEQQQHPQWRQQAPAPRGALPTPPHISNTGGAMFESGFTRGNPGSQARPPPSWRQQHSGGRPFHGNGTGGEDVGFHHHHHRHQQEPYHLPMNSPPLHDPGQPPPPPSGDGGGGGQQRRSAYAAAMHHKRFMGPAPPAAAGMGPRGGLGPAPPREELLLPGGGGGGGFVPSPHGPPMMPPPPRPHGEPCPREPLNGFHGRGTPPVGHWRNGGFTGVDGFHGGVVGGSGVGVGVGGPMGPGVVMQPWSSFGEGDDDEEGFPLVHTSPEWTPAMGAIKAAQDMARMSPASENGDDDCGSDGGSRSGGGEAREEAGERRGGDTRAAAAGVDGKEKSDEPSPVGGAPQVGEGKATGAEGTEVECDVAPAAASVGGESASGAPLSSRERRLEPKPLAKVMWSIGDLVHRFPR